MGGSEILIDDSLSAFIQMLIAGGHVEIVLPLLSLAGLLFFIGCTGKSAQIPLLTWLPDAMAGPARPVAPPPSPASPPAGGGPGDDLPF